MAKLSEKRKRFVDEYLVDLNATQAAIRAGYSPNTANEQGSRLLTNVSISDAVAHAQAERSRRTGISADRVIRELACIAFVNPADVINTSDATVRPDASEDDLAAIQSVKVRQSESETGSMTEREIRLCDKLRALELLGRHLGMFKDSSDNTAPVTINIAYDYGDQ